jgi:hypothetical protein
MEEGVIQEGSSETLTLNKDMEDLEEQVMKICRVELSGA